MLDLTPYGEFKTAWCPGCGDFSILKALKTALASLHLKPSEVLMVSGIGQAAKTPHYLKCNVFNGLHGRALPAAQGAKLAHPGLTVIAESGDGCSYGEGGNHFLAAIRRNVNISLFVHDNQVYGLTKGQTSPTTLEGQATTSDPEGTLISPFAPLAVAVALQASFVARGFSGNIEQLANLMRLAIQHPGFALVDILQPCVSFNKVNTLSWYKERCYDLPEDYDPTDWSAAMLKAVEFEERIPLGVLYTTPRSPLDAMLPPHTRGPLLGQPVDRRALDTIMATYG